MLWAKVVDFAKCVDECGLIQLPYQGGRYTWNDNSGDARIFSKND